MATFGIAVQDNPFSDAPIYIATEDSEDVFALKCSGTILMANTRTPTDQELSTCTLYFRRNTWDPQKVRFPEASQTVEEENFQEGQAIRQLL
jgi:glutamine amidotransferase PdxT